MKSEHSILRLVSALEFIASKSLCECWDTPAMGSGLPYVWRGCRAHNSGDPEEWCLCCTAHAALNDKRRADAETQGNAEFKAVLDRLQPLAERWNENPEWHVPPFTHGRIHVDTGTLKDIAYLIEYLLPRAS